MFNSCPMGPRRSCPKGHGNGIRSPMIDPDTQDEAEKIDPAIIKGLFEHGV